MAGYTYGACMRRAYKCMCDCIDQKSYSELPYKLPTLPATNEPIATTATEVIGLGYRTTFVIYVTQLPAKSINWLMYI